MILSIPYQLQIMIQVQPSNIIQIYMSESIVIKNVTNQSIKLDVDLEKDTVKKIIEEYADKTGLDTDTVQLIYQGKPLLANEKMINTKLSDLDIQNNSTLFAVMRLRGGNLVKLIVQTVNGKSHELSLNSQMTVAQLKTKVHNDLCDSLGNSQMCLRYAGVQLQNNKKLSSYKIVEKGKEIKILQEKQGLGKIAGIILAYEEDIWGMDEEGTKMPCGHVVGRDGMTGFIRSLIDGHNFQIRCPGIKPNGKSCEYQWPFKLCKKIGVFTKEETKKFEEGLSLNWIKRNSSECPKCKQRVIKGVNITHNRVRCPCCDYGDFCYECLQSWKKSGMDVCGNKNCSYLKKFLEQAPFDKIFKLKQNGQYKDFLLPKVRACPNCRTIIEVKSGCKHMECNPKGGGCGKYFCWVCLEVKSKITWDCGSYNEYCGKIAQPQTFD